MGERPANPLNQASVDGYVRVDAGVGYTTKIDGKTLTLRALLENVADEDYWAGAGNNLLAQGYARTLRLTARMAF